MTRAAQLLVLIGMMLVAQAHAADPAGPSAIGKRHRLVQMVDCVKKRMSDDKSRSYNDAMKACKDELNKENGASASRALVASETPPKE